jgi:ABC-type bacteriocin/lantibiotic exporter with double-glycine peptidase domain
MSQIVGALMLQVLASTALLGIGGFLVIKGSLTLGQLVAAELIVTVVVGGVAKMGRHLEHWYDLNAASQKIAQLLDVPVEKEGTLVAPTREARGPAALELRDVAWRDARGRALFSGLDLSVAPGTSVSITGPSGSGKTALLEMLWRMREPTEGAIRLDGRDYRDLSPADVRKEIAIVSEVEVVQGTVRENVRLHRPFVTDDDVLRAIETSGLRDTIAELPDGLETVIYPNGRAFSGNELKQLMLARALAGSPRLLVVDSLFDRIADPLRGVLLEAIFSEGGGRSLLIVTDMRDVAQRCDRTLELSPGERARVSGLSAGPAEGDR